MSELVVADSVNRLQPLSEAKKEKEEGEEEWTTLEREMEPELCKLFSSLECLNGMLVTWEGQVVSKAIDKAV